MGRSETDPEIVVLYHGDCKDGFGAAWAAWKKFGTKARYIPVRHGRPVPPGLGGKDVYILDFTYPEAVTRGLMAESGRLTVIDHHISQKAVTVLAQNHVFDECHSGAVLAWKHFHPERKVPTMLGYIEDQDLWCYNMYRTKDICSFINMTDRDFSQWDRMALQLEKPSIVDKFAEGGAIINRYTDLVVREIIEKNPRLVSFLGHTVYAVNAHYRFASAIGAILHPKQPPFVIIWREHTDCIGVSLRSQPDGFDVSRLAQRFGGGGHRHSAGFTLPLGTKLPWDRPAEAEPRPVGELV